MIKNYKLGADPEFFLIDGNTGKFFPATGLIGGTKSEPIPISNDGHAIQEDNVMVEFNVPPVESYIDMDKNIQYVLTHIKTILPPNLKISIVPSAIFDPEHLLTEQAQQFGCEPDFNIYLMDINDSPDPSTTLRCAGGHIHFGYPNPSNEISFKLIMLFDLFLGVPSIIKDTDRLRRTMYGKAGAFRFKEYGFEYRSLSNFWIKDKESIKWVFDGVNQAVNNINNIDNFDFNLIQKCINNQDIALANIIIEQYKVLPEYAY